MAKRELINYQKTNPCPICGRYKTAYRNKCHGFIASDKYVYCSREETAIAKSLFEGAITVYRHDITNSNSSSTTKLLPPSPSARGKVADAGESKDWPTKHLLNPNNFCMTCSSHWCPGAKPSLYPKRKDKIEKTDKQWLEYPGPTPEVMEELDRVIAFRQSLGEWPYPRSGEQP